MQSIEEVNSDNFMSIQLQPKMQMSSFSLPEQVAPTNLM